MYWSYSDDLLSARADVPIHFRDINFDVMVHEICRSYLQTSRAEIIERVAKYISAARGSTTLDEWFEVPEIEAERIALKLAGVRRSAFRPSSQPLFDTEIIPKGSRTTFFRKR